MTAWLQRIGYTVWLFHWLSSYLVLLLPSVPRGSLIWNFLLGVQCESLCFLLTSFAGVLASEFFTLLVKYHLREQRIDKNVMLSVVVCLKPFKSLHTTCFLEFIFKSTTFLFCGHTYDFSFPYYIHIIFYKIIHDLYNWIKNVNISLCSICSIVVIKCSEFLRCASDLLAR